MSEPKLPFPTKPLFINGRKVEEYIIPEEKRKQVLEQLYPFEDVPNLDALYYDIREDKIFKVGQYRVTREDDMNYLVSPYYPLSGGTVMYWMPASKDDDLQFLQSVKETFDSVFNEYKFEFQNETIWNKRGKYYAIKALKGDLELIFCLSPLPQFCHFNLSINASGKSAEKAISSAFRSITINAIAHRIDPNYNQPHTEIRTKQELKEVLEIEKECLLKYCKNILLGDVSIWLNVVNGYVEEFRKSGLKVE